MSINIPYTQMPRTRRDCQLLLRVCMISLMHTKESTTKDQSRTLPRTTGNLNLIKYPNLQLYSNQNAQLLVKCQYNQIQLIKIEESNELVEIHHKDIFINPLWTDLPATRMSCAWPPWSCTRRPRTPSTLTTPRPTLKETMSLGRSHGTTTT